MQGYLSKATSAFFDAGRSVHVRESFRRAALRHKDAGRVWLRLLESISSEQVREVLERVPHDRISNVAREFAQKVLELNRLALLDMGEEMQ